MSDYWKKQMEHEPTRLYAETLDEIVKELKPKTVLEIGTGWGISGSVFMKNGVELLVTIDASTRPEYLDTAKNEIELHRKDPQVVNYNWMRSSEYFEKNDEKFDLVYIDGDHGYAGAKFDLEEALKRLNPGGKIVMDDYLHVGNYIPNNECRIAQGVREVLSSRHIKATIYPHNKDNGFLVI